jgi:hypothetical protein
MNISNEQLAGRMAAIEFLMIQTLAMLAKNYDDKDAMFAIIKQSFAQRTDRLPEDVRWYAVDAADRVLSSALASAKL